MANFRFVRMLPCKSVANCPLPCESHGFQKFQISASDFGTVSMRRRFRPCAYEFLTMVTKGVVHCVHKVVIQSSFGLIRRHKVSYGIGRFAMCPYDEQG